MKIVKNSIIKKTLLLPAFFALAVNLNAQTTTTTSTEPTATTSSNSDLKNGEFGIRYMPTFAKLDLKTYDGGTSVGSATMSHGFGIMLAYNFGKNVGLQGEINYYALNQKYVDRSLNREVEVKYLNIPLMFSFNTNKTLPINFNVVAGPQFGLNIGSSVTTNGVEASDTLQAVVAVKTGDVGFAYGAGFEFAFNKAHTMRFDVGFRGYYGLVDMDGTKTGTDTYNVILKTSRKTYGGYVGVAFLF